MSKNSLEPMKKEELIIALILGAVQMAHVLDFVIIMPLGPVLMEELDLSSKEFGWLVSSYNFAAGISGFFVGLFADKFERKKLLTTAFCGFILATLACSLANDFFSFLSFRTITGICGGALNGLVMALITDFISIGVRGRAISIVLSSFSVSSVIGVPLGLAINDWYGWQSTFIFVGSFSAAILLMAIFLLPQVGNKSTDVGIKDFLESFGRILFKPKYIYGYCFLGMLAFALFLMIPFLNPYIVKNIGISNKELKFLYLYGGIFTVITARIFGSLTDRYGPHKILLLIVMLSTPLVLWFGTAGPTQYWQFILYGCLFMSFVSNRMIPGTTLISEIPTEKERGRFMSITNSFRSLCVASAALVSGYIIDETSEKIINYDVLSYSSVILGVVAVCLSFGIKYKGKRF